MTPRGITGPNGKRKPGKHFEHLFLQLILNRSLPASRDVMGNNEEGQPGDQIAAGGGDSLAAGGASRHRAGRGQWHRYPGGRAGT